MHESPRIRRLRNDFAALERLGSESSVLRFRAEGKPAQRYVIEFRGRSLARERGKVAVRERHEVEIKLGASYPRTMPEIRWLTPIYHPNISEIGMVCLGGYGTHWVPSLNLDELCGMLWDMARFHNYDIRSPYNREAALWVANQTSFLFPLDPRALRDLRVALGRVESQAPAPTPPSNEPEGPNRETGGAKAPSDPAPGSKSGKYADFVRKFASELNALTPSRPDAVPRGEDRNRTGAGSEVRDGIVIFDLEVDLRPESTRPRPRPDDEIVFID
jgi:ubiquitin-protein ligase